MYKELLEAIKNNDTETLNAHTINDRVKYYQSVIDGLTDNTGENKLEVDVFIQGGEIFGDGEDYLFGAWNSDGIPVLGFHTEDDLRRQIITINQPTE
ncbi:hypothetical protein KKE60_06720 [Patescibacteria group bacterium]|nr:hypothetical protein [Patescibacteria group bacterium]